MKPHQNTPVRDPHEHRNTIMRFVVIFCAVTAAVVIGYISFNEARELEHTEYMYSLESLVNEVIPLISSGNKLHAIIYCPIQVLFLTLNKIKQDLAELLRRQNMLLKHWGYFLV